MYLQTIHLPSCGSVADRVQTNLFVRVARIVIIIENKKVLGVETCVMFLR